MRPIVLACVCVLGCGLTVAEDSPINDLRLGLAYGVAEKPEYEIETFAKDEVDADHLRLSLSYLVGVRELSRDGTIFLGGSLFRETSNGEGEGDLAGLDVGTDTLGVGIEAGYAHRLPAIGFSLEGALQLGYLHQGIGAGGTIGAGYDIAQTGFEYALRVSAEYAFAERWMAGLDLRWLLGSRTDGTVNDRDTTYTNHGLSIGANVGYRL